MKNLYGETVKPQYEVALKRVASWREDQEQALEDWDMETYGHLPADNYRDAVRRAKDISKKIGTLVESDYGKSILREVDIICYFEDDTSSYNQVWEEEYKDGKKVGRFEL